MIIFNEITLIGFGSIIHKTKFKLSRVGLNIIRGNIGSGKTTIPSALYWVLYDQTLKKNSSVQTWPELQGNDFKGTMVSVKLSKGKSNYEIIRCISYKEKIFNSIKGGSGIHIIKDGEYLKIKGKKNIQEKINSILNYSPDLFINSVIFGQRLKRIIDESGPNKKKIFDEAFEITYIDKSKELVELERKELLLLSNNYENELDNLQSKLETLKEAYKYFLKYENSFKDNKKKDKKDIKSEISKTLKSINDIETKLTDIPKLKLDDIESKVSNIRTKINNHNNELSLKVNKVKELKNTFNEVNNKISKLEIESVKLKENKCYTCGSIIKSKKVKELKSFLENYKKEYKKQQEKLDHSKLEFEIKKLKSDISKLDIKYSTQLKELKEAREIHTETKILEKQLENRKISLDEYRTKLKEVNKRKLEKESHKYNNSIIDIKQQLDNKKNELSNIIKKKEIKDWLVKDPLSNNGIKAYLFNSLLSKVNYKLNEYSKLLGFRIEFGIDLASSTKNFYQLIYKDNIVVLYEDLSGGQKQLVDTSVALAIHDVISSIRPTNILFLDEPFEGLDPDSINLMSDIITQKSNEQTIFLITHHTSFNANNANTIYFKQNSNGATEIY
jgi:DNA repair exonuclease SbcCD ATPase subunit